ncbi:maestro heat-like repeat-containing protein family member 1 [Cetorhinus maximus]
MDADCAQLYLGALIAAASDTDGAVRRQVAESLCALGLLHPGLVLSSCHASLSGGRARLDDGHRPALLRIMALVAGETAERIERPLAREVIVAAAAASTDEAGPLDQEAASELLVALGRGFAAEVLDQLLGKFKPGIFPHPMVIRTLTELSGANVEGMVPRLPLVLTMLQPAFGLVKEKSHVCVLASALGLFSKSILQYFRPSDKAPDPNLSDKDALARTIYTLYKNHLSKWLQEKDAKVRAAILEALGHMVPLLPRDRLEEELPGLVPQLLSLYGKQPGGLPVTQCLLSVLGASVGGGEGGSPCGLRGQADKLLAALHVQLCGPVTPGDLQGLRNREGTLGCLALLAREWPQPVVQFILGKLATTGGRQRVANLTALARIVDTAPSELRGKRGQIVAALKVALTDDSEAVKGAVLRTIGSLASHGYLESPEGTALVNYTVGLCAVPEEGEVTGRAQGPCEGDGETPGEGLRPMAEALLEQIADAEGTTGLVWPALLRFLTPVPYTRALPVVCRCLEKLVGRQRESGTFHPHQGTTPGLPDPQALLARLLSLSSAPGQAPGRGPAALSLLLALGPTIHPWVEGLWEEEIPELARALGGSAESGMVREHREERLLLFLSRSLEEIGEERWSLRLVDRMMQQGRQLAGCPRERGFLFQCRGLVLKQTGSEEVVRAQLREMLRSAQYQQALEREGLALGIGLCADRHLDDALGQLEDFARPHLSQKAATFLKLVKGRPGGEEAEAVRSGILLCYGRVAQWAPAERLRPEFGADVLGLVLLLYQGGAPESKGKPRGQALKLSLTQAVTLTARAVLDKGPRLSRRCPAKGELLSCLEEMAGSEPGDPSGHSLRCSALTACGLLVQLEPESGGDLTSRLLRSCAGGVIGTEGGSGGEEDQAQRRGLAREASAALQGLLRQVLLRDLSPRGLQAVFRTLEGWTVSGRAHERERALELTAGLLAFFLESLGPRPVVSHCGLEAMVGRLVPRCADTSPAVRRLALDCLCALFSVQRRYQGFPAEGRDGSVERLKALLGSRAAGKDGADPRQACREVARAVSERTPACRLRDLLAALFEGLTDPQPGCAIAAGAAIHAVLARRGPELRVQAPGLLQDLCARLRGVGHQGARLAAAPSLAALARHHPADAIAALLASGPDPCRPEGALVWRSLGGRVAELLLAELGGPGGPAAARALSAILSHPGDGPALDGLYPRLLGTLLVPRSGAGPDPQRLPAKGNPREPMPQNLNLGPYSVAALKALLSRGSGAAVVASLEEAGGWQMMEDPGTYPHGVALLAEAMVSQGSPHLDGLVEYLAAAPTFHQSQPAAVAAFFGQLVKHHAAFDLRHMDILVSGLLRALLDRSPATRLLAVKGLGDVALTDPARVRRYSAKLLAALLVGAEEVDGPRQEVALEVLAGLSKVLAQLEEDDVRGLLVNLCLGIRPFFEERSDRVRASALSLFGALSKFAVGQSEPVLVEQVHSVLVHLLLYLNQSSPEVRQASGRVLASVAPLVGSDDLCVTFQSQLPQGRSPCYWAFLSKLTRSIAWDLPDYIQTYLSSSLHFCSNPSPEIRANAVIFTGHLLKNMPKDNSRLWGDEDDHVHQAIALMIRDPAASVRMTTAKTLSLFS